jgi:cobalt-zinc-cadmium efflux system membrane fusion protein
MLRKLITNKFLLAAGLLLSISILSGCTMKKESSSDSHAFLNHEDSGLGDELHDHDHDGDAGHNESTWLQLTSEQRQRIHLEIVEASPGTLYKELSFPGEIRLNQDSHIRIIPRVSGVVREVSVTKGDRVRKGQVLAVLESPVMGEVKATFLDACRERRYNKADLDRFRKIQENTLALIKLLDSQPLLTEMGQEIFGDMADYGSRLISAYADYSIARKAFDRKKNLYEKQIASEKDYLDAQGAYEGTRAAYLAQLANTNFSLEQEMLSLSETFQASHFSMKAAERQLEILGLTEEEIQRLSESAELAIDAPEQDYSANDLTRVQLRAPRSGTILERSVGLGEKVDSDTTVFTLADMDHVWACLQVPSRDLASVKTGQKVAVESESGEKTTGTVSVIDPVVSGNTRTAELRAVIINDSDKWKPGLFIRGFLEQPAAELGMVIHAKALQVIEGEEIVFVPRGEGFMTIPVKTGRSDRNSVEILSGLLPGMKYVTEGAFELKSMMVTGSLDPHAGHGH